MGKLTRPFNEPTFSASQFRAENKNLIDTHANNISNDFLLIQFRLFIDKVLKIIKTSKIPEHNPVDVDTKNLGIEEEKIDKNTNDNSLDLPEIVLAKQVNKNLQKFLDVQDMELMRRGSRSEQNRFEDAKYLKAAVADELLLTKKWPGQKFFTNYLIETSIFGTSVAGEKIFDEIHQILESPPGREPEIEQLYLFALAIGFEGKYKGYNSEKDISHILNELFSHITRREPELGPKKIDTEIQYRLLSEQPYQHTISNIKPVRIFKVSKQSVIFIILFLILLLLSQFLWVWFSSPLRDSLNQIAVNPYKIQLDYCGGYRANIATILQDGEMLNG